MDEMRESTRIVAQCVDRLEAMQGEPWIADDRKVVLPPREELHTSMESLIHHFKIVTEGYRVPEGEVYVVVESPRGELGCYVVSDGGPKRVGVGNNFPGPPVGAQQVLEAFEAELGIRAGETTEDGAFTLGTVECAGGCGWGTVVAVDSRYREPVKPEDVPAIVEELKG